jgi:hypothetical protein
MKVLKKLPSLAAALLIVGQLGLAGVALADDAPASPSPESTPSQSPSPTPSDSPDPSASPSPNSSPSPSASPAPDPSPSPSASPEPDRKYTDIGPDGCGGVVPDWVYDVATSTWAEADKSSFSCDRASGYYLSPLYTFDKRSGWYEIMPPSAPAADYLLSAPQVVHTTLGDVKVDSPDYQVAKSLGLLDGPNSIAVSGTGPSSSNQATVNNSGQSWLDLTNMVNVINSLQSAANSGNVTAGSNTQVGNSVSGAASVVANLINLLASAWAWSNGSLSFFMQNILGNQTGDISLNPTQSKTGGGGQLGGSAQIANTGPDSTNVGGVNNSNTLSVNAKNSGNIVNNVDVGAASGDASAAGNTSAGNVASGNAVAEVNIINLINSMINSGDSFFGILNIFGNLNGDVLFPNNFLNGLVPSGAGTGGSAAAVTGTGPDSTNGAVVDNSGQTTINNQILNNAANNINATAASGSASASSNTSAGSLSSGSASTTQGTFNLANSSIFGENAVLVIVNVLGHWFGKIMDLPGGSTESALLTGNATVGTNGTGPDSVNHAGVSDAAKANIDQSSEGSITNNVKVSAKSGNATASKNTSVGDVSTGDAKASSSVANIFNSVLNIKHWFGVLIINVFGDWTGDVNHNSAAGNEPSEKQSAAAAQVVAAITSSSPRDSGTHSGTSSIGGGSGSAQLGDSSNASAPKPQVLTAAVQGSTGSAGRKAPDMSFLFGIAAILMLAAGATASIERRLRKR